MITFIINIIYSFLNFLINLFPTGTGFPEDFHTSATMLGGYLQMLDVILPIEALAICITTLITVELALFGFKTIKWAISHIPWIGGKG